MHRIRHWDAQNPPLDAQNLPLGHDWIKIAAAASWLVGRGSPRGWAGFPLVVSIAAFLGTRSGLAGLLDFGSCTEFTIGSRLDHDCCCCLVVGRVPLVVGRGSTAAFSGTRSGLAGLLDFGSCPGYHGGGMHRIHHWDVTELLLLPRGWTGFPSWLGGVPSCRFDRRVFGHAFRSCRTA
jgi:hypothetical protein